MQNYGLVSIITPSWACGGFIAETIQSVLAQTYPYWEMLVQDDCSIDNTEDVVAVFAAADSRIKYEKNERHCGAANTRNNAIRRAKGRWIAFLDSDDIWLPEKLEHQLKFMSEQNHAFTYHEYTEMNEDGKDMGVYVSGKKCVRKFDMYTCCWPGCLTVMYDAEKIGLVQIEDIRKNNDTALWLKVVRKVPCYLMKENLAKYRRRDSSITPKSMWHRVCAHYPLFHISEDLNPIMAILLALVNVFGNGMKKLFYVEKFTVK